LGPRRSSREIDLIFNSTRDDRDEGGEGKGAGEGIGEEKEAEAEEA
jgi:hypothetical protein